jgi:tRNA(Arg) A34 adenosine deaminase TadA
MGARAFVFRAMRRRCFALVALGVGAPWARGQPAAGERAAFAARAMALRDEAIRRGDQPYGAVVVKDGAIVGEGVSAVVTLRDPDAHAERLALADARRRLRGVDLAGCELYGSARACAVCEAAAARAGIARLYYGAAATDGGVPRSIAL